MAKKVIANPFHNQGLQFLDEGSGEASFWKTSTLPNYTKDGDYQFTVTGADLSALADPSALADSQRTFSTCLIILMRLAERRSSIWT